ncbi:cell wall metabolism sensor histidine kinase WalK [Aeromicrobium sp. Leaf350]|uniref:sensor histidine kinase n=1 Tax=Aeromicrobium sp. Leaf350 TaxID=2876565 RepID=UPI001E4C5F20|nr:HAMP domain-containing sensor histidine kinase [Aeromicrobium sp. Leaf350]
MSQATTEREHPRRGVVETVHQRMHQWTLRVSLAARVATLTTAAVALTLSSVSAGVYVVVRAELVDNLDASIRARAEQAVAAGYTPGALNEQDADLLDVAGMEIYRVEGDRVLATLTGSTKVQLTETEVAVSLGQQTSSARTAMVDGDAYRVVAVQAGPAAALVMVQRMDSVQHTLDRLGLVLVITTLAGMAVAGAAGWAVASNGLRPVRRLTRAAEHVARTQELQPIEVVGRDELARLTTSFNQMLVALDASQSQQRRLVADAGHELRTPLTSLRTNIELLTQANAAGRPLTDDQSTEVMVDISAQVEELTSLIGDLVELARDEPLHHDPEPLDLSEVVQHAINRVQLRAPAVTFEATLEPWWVVGEPRALERAVTNLLDNAAKWSPSEGTVQVSLLDGVVTVRDHGPGIAEADLPHVFERFYRSREARTLPGSGLGLSIVRRAAERHGGTVEVESEPGEGATFRMTVPGSNPSPPHTSVSEPSQ